MMAKYANAGELRTIVYFKQVIRITDADGFTEETENNVFGQDEFGQDVPVKCKWENAHGTEVFAGMQLKLKEPATLTMRYSPKINKQLLCYIKGDKNPYELISIDNVNNLGRWLELKIQRKEGAR